MSGDFGPGKNEDREEGQFISGSPYMSHFPGKPKPKKHSGTSLERAIDERNQAQHFLSLLETQLEAQGDRLDEEQHRETELQEELKKKRGMNQYQMAFLWIQNAMGVLVKTCRGNHDKALAYAFQQWKGQASGLRNRLVVNTQGAVRLVKDRLRQALLAYKSTQKQGLFDAFSKWKFQASLRKTKAAFDRKREERFQAQRKELKDCELEIDRLTAQQPELEQRMSDLMLNEKTYKDTITRLRGERDAVGASRAQLEAESKEQSRAQEVRLERRLEDLERENQELQEKMTALENNVVFFIKEMSGLIDFQENIRADKDSPMHRGSRPTDKKPDRSKPYAGARNLNLEF